MVKAHHGVHSRGFRFTHVGGGGGGGKRISWLVNVQTANKRVFLTTYTSLRNVYLGVGGILGIFQ